MTAVLSRPARAPVRPAPDPVLAYGRRGLPWVLVGLLLGLAAGGAVLATRTPVAHSTAVLGLTAVAPSIELGGTSRPISVDTDAQLLKSDEVVGAAAAAAGRTPEQARDALSVTARQLTRVLEVTYTDRSPSAAQAGATAAAQAFLAARERLVLVPVRTALQQLGQVLDVDPVTGVPTATADSATPLARQQAALAAELALDGPGAVLEAALRSPASDRGDPEVPLGTGASVGALLGFLLGLLRERRRAAAPVLRPAPAAVSLLPIVHRTRRQRVARGLAWVLGLALVGLAAGTAAATQLSARPAGQVDVLVRPLPGNAFATRQRDNSVDLQTEAQLALSDVVLSQVPRTGGTVAVLRARVRVAVVPGAEVVSVTVRARSQRAAVADAAAVASALLAERQARATAAYARQADVLRSRIAQTQTSITGSVAAAASPDLVLVLSQRLATLQNDLLAVPTDATPGAVVDTTALGTGKVGLLRRGLPGLGGLGGAGLGLLVARRAPRTRRVRVRSWPAAGSSSGPAGPPPAAGPPGLDGGGPDGLGPDGGGGGRGGPGGSDLDDGGLGYPAPLLVEAGDSVGGVGDEAPPAAGPGNVERMARAGGLSVAGAAVAAVSGVLLTGLITRGLPQAEAGTVFATTAAFLILTSLVQVGTEVGVVRWLPGLLVRGEGRLVRAVLRTALLPVLSVAVAAGLVLLVLAEPAGRLIADGAATGVVAGQVRVLAVLLPVTALYNVLLAATRGLRTMRPTVLVESLGRSVLQLAAVASAVAVGAGPVGVVVAFSLPWVVGLLCVAAWLRRLLRGTGDRVADDTPATDPAARAAATAGFWRFCGPRAVSTTSQWLLKRSDVVLVAALRSTREAALYAAATRFVVLGQYGVQALQQALSPQLAALFARDDTTGAREVYRVATAWSMLGAWPVYLAAAVLAPELLALFGSGYDQVASSAVLVSLAMLAAVACGAVDAVLLMSGHPWLSLGNNLVALGLNVGLNLLLIPDHGAFGAAVAFTVAIVVRNLLPLLQIGRRYGISPVGRETGLVALCAVGCFGLLPLGVRLLTPGSLPVLGALAVGAVLYLTLLWRMRGALRIGAFRGLLRRRPRAGLA